MISIKRMLVPMDFSHSARHSLDIAVNLAEKFQAQIHLLHVFEMPLTKAFNYQHLVSTEVKDSELNSLIKAETEDVMEALVHQLSSGDVPVPIHPIYRKWRAFCGDPTGGKRASCRFDSHERL